MRCAKWLGFGAFYLLLIEAGAHVVLTRQLADVPLDKRIESAQEQTARNLPLRESKSPIIANEGIHPYLGYMPRRYPRLGPNLEVMFDEGFYAPDSAIFSKDENDLVVAIAGGSLAGQFTKSGGIDELGPLLAKMPKYAGRKVRFVSLALGGCKQPQQLMSLSWVLSLGGRLDVLINIDGYNEVALHERENQVHEVSLLYPRAWYPRIQAISIAPLMGELQYRRRLRAEALEDFESSPVAWSRLRSLLWLRGDIRMKTENDVLELAVRNAVQKKERDIVLQGPPAPPGGVASRLEGLAEVWLQGSLNLGRISGAYGIDYYHFLQPNQYLEDSKPMGPEEKAIALANGKIWRKPVQQGFSRLLKRSAELVESGLRFHDLRDVFQGVEEPVYKDACCHVNELGNLYIAREIAASIESW